MGRDLSSRVHQYETKRTAMKATYMNITEIYNMIVLCKRSKSLRYPGKHMYNYGLWTIEPSIWSIIGYSVVIPIVSALGIIGNALILAIHLKAKTYLKASVFTYLAGISVVMLRASVSEILKFSTDL